jgi:uncharacterized protein with ParB-like and HNH nuclease domain
MNEVSSNNPLCLKNIHDLLGETFLIPAYQRGYRWSALQVKELLDDVWEFSQKENSEDSAFYCLQPIVVTQQESSWSVVDGQQRLTTLYLILNYLEREHLRRPLKDAYKKDTFRLEYETRDDSANFLRNINPELQEKNIDYYHITKAYEAIELWFRDKDYNDSNAFLGILLAKPTDTRSVKVIWYDLTEECRDNDYATEVFSRINIGKIPLTNAELVKALFLQKTRFKQNEADLKQLQIASEWDAIEKRLRDPGLWHFLYRSDVHKDYSTRIEFIFDLMKEKKQTDESFYTFHKFSSDFKGTEDIDSLWKEVKKYFLTFEEWYRDKELYHFIGFLVDCGHKISEIKKVAEKDNITKVEFKNYLRGNIKKEVSCQVDELNYWENKQLIKKILLLFNIVTLLGGSDKRLETNGADTRFPFDKYIEQKWDIEHIRSQTDIPLGAQYRIAWIDDALNYFNDNRALDKSDFSRELLRLRNQSKIDDHEFNLLYEKIRRYFDEFEDYDWIHGLGNLALLDSYTNRSYKNSMFPIKRARIIDNDMKGLFVPICTKNTFLKFYSSSFEDLLHWKSSDAIDYLASIKKVLSAYLPEQGTKHG